ncbi:unnamed protein product (macronuclear) [Paramecium tetraurelia]|uniref:Uncharacterized protein n=1 Tax=Paramecium tetraurelia TaxID=5888 RepID=A0CZ99_PARTE|nr:uncharacterized protein GSPATT00011689001 [Paramecium tetraurelia]CAK76116.1 unnamed protein product [Paramecium tetraurelia]
MQVKSIEQFQVNIIVNLGKIMEPSQTTLYSKDLKDELL